MQKVKIGQPETIHANEIISCLLQKKNFTTFSESSLFSSLKYRGKKAMIYVFIYSFCVWRTQLCITSAPEERRTTICTAFVHPHTLQVVSFPALSHLLVFDLFYNF